MGSIEDLGLVIDESTVLQAEIDAPQRTLRLRLAILAHPTPGSAQRPQLVLVFAPMSRIACRVSKVEDFADPTPEQPWRMGSRQVGGPVRVDGIVELNEWLRRFRGDLYGQPYPMFDRLEPDWLSEPSLDETWATTGGHAIDLGFDKTAVSSHHVMMLRAWFEDVSAFDRDERQVDVGVVVESVRAWWADFRAGRTRGEYGYIPAGE